MLVASRTQLINHVRGVVKSFGGKLPKASAAYFHHKVKDVIPDVLKAALKPLLRSIAQLSKEIKTLEKQLAKLAKSRYPETALLRQVQGVGLLLSLGFVLTIEQATRFKKSRDVAAYLGLVPKRYQSGDRDPSLGITKRGDRFLRHLLIQSAQYLLGPFSRDCDLKRFGLRLKEKGGSGGKQRAVIAVARKLAGLLHHLWITGEVYDPHYQAKPSEAI